MSLLVHIILNTYTFDTCMMNIDGKLFIFVIAFLEFHESLKRTNWNNDLKKTPFFLYFTEMDCWEVSWRLQIGFKRYRKYTAIFPSFQSYTSESKWPQPQVTYIWKEAAVCRLKDTGSKTARQRSSQVPVTECMFYTSCMLMWHYSLRRCSEADWESGTSYCWAEYWLDIFALISAKWSSIVKYV